MDEDSVHEQVKKIAATIQMLPDEKAQEAALKALHAQSPVTYSLVMQRIQKMNAEYEMQMAQLEEMRIEQEKQRLEMTDKALEVEDRKKHPEGYRKIKPRNEDKSGPKRDAQSGKQKA